MFRFPVTFPITVPSAAERNNTREKAFCCYFPPPPLFWIKHVSIDLLHYSKCGELLALSTVMDSDTFQNVMGCNRFFKKSMVHFVDSGGHFRQPINVQYKYFCSDRSLHTDQKYALARCACHKTKAALCFLQTYCEKNTLSVKCFLAQSCQDCCCLFRVGWRLCKVIHRLNRPG